MRLTSFLAPAIAAGLTVSAASAAEVTRTPNLSGFTRVEARRAFEVEIRRGDTFHVEVRTDDAVADQLDVHTTGDRLIIDMKDSFRVWRNQKALAIVTMPTLRAFQGSGATKTRITGFRSTDAVDINLSGASQLEGAFESGNTRLEISGASKAELDGRGGALHVDASGASHADLANFVTSNAALRLSGASNASINTAGRLDVDSSGASHITYKGHPQLGSVRSSGASSLRSRD